jgi:hypothetical protein
MRRKARFAFWAVDPCRHEVMTFWLGVFGRYDYARSLICCFDSLMRICMILVVYPVNQVLTARRAHSAADETSGRGLPHQRPAVRNQDRIAAPYRAIDTFLDERACNRVHDHSYVQQQCA